MLKSLESCAQVIRVRGQDQCVGWLRELSLLGRGEGGGGGRGERSKQEQGSM